MAALNYNQLSELCNAQFTSNDYCPRGFIGPWPRAHWAHSFAGLKGPSPVGPVLGESIEEVIGSSSFNRKTIYFPKNSFSDPNLALMSSHPNKPENPTFTQIDLCERYTMGNFLCLHAWVMVLINVLPNRTALTSIKFNSYYRDLH